MNMPWTNVHGAAKVVVVCVAVFLVSAGLCGIESVTLSAVHHMPDNAAGVLIGVGVLGAVGMILSALVGFIALLVWGIGGIFRRGQ